MNEQILNTVQFIPWTIFIQLSIVAIVALLFKKLYNNIVSYIMFRSNEDLGSNVRVKVNGNIGVIKKYNWKFIYVQLEDDGNIMLIPITKWNGYKWEICKIK